MITSLFYRQGNLGTERLRDLPKVTQVKRNKLGSDPRSSGIQPLTPLQVPLLPQHCQHTSSLKSNECLHLRVHLRDSEPLSAAPPFSEPQAQRSSRHQDQIGLKDYSFLRNARAPTPPPLPESPTGPCPPLPLGPNAKLRQGPGFAMGWLWGQPREHIPVC